MNTTQRPQAQPLPANARLAVRFLSRWQNYYAGDVAAFPARMAASLVARGKAERVNIAPPDVAPPEGAEWALRRPGNHVSKRQRAEDDLDLL
jgi:hypothetical protein